MSYALSAPLQAAVFAALRADAALAALVGDAIHDALPSGPVPPIHVGLGEETVDDRSDGTASGALHRITITVTTDVAGFALAKQAAAAVCDALADADLILSRGRLVALRFERARARRAGPAAAIRQIDLRFAARVEDE